jgi:PHD/YefM family antitoxin component YafN of YafNO toxin-antitoxin module
MVHDTNANHILQRVPADPGRHFGERHRRPLAVDRHRDRGKPAAVLMSLEDYASLEETRYLLSSPANAERPMASIAELEDCRIGRRQGNRARVA